MSRWKWRAVAGTWAAAMAVVVAIGVADQWAAWTQPEPVYSNARTVATPVGPVEVETDGILLFPGSAIRLIVRGRQDGVRAIDGVRYSLTPRAGGHPAVGAAPLAWVQSGPAVEAQVENLFPDPPGSRVEGRGFALGEYDLVVEFRTGDRVVATSPPLGLRVEKKRHY